MSLFAVDGKDKKNLGSCRTGQVAGREARARDRLQDLRRQDLRAAARRRPRPGFRRLMIEALTQPQLPARQLVIDRLPTRPSASS